MAPVLFSPQQDDRLKDTQKELEELKMKYSGSSSQLEELRQQVQQLKDQNALLKATKGRKTYGGSH